MVSEAIFKAKTQATFLVLNLTLGGGGGGGGKTGPFQKFGNMMSGMAKGGLDFLTSIPMKLTNIIGAKVRFIQGIGQAKMQGGNSIDEISASVSPFS